MRIRFDRGTLVIDRAGSPVDPQSLPGVAWDPRVHSWRARADAYASVIGRLADEGVPYSDEVGQPERALGPAPELRWYQEEALAAWGAARHRGVIALPTGSGKTILAIAAIARLGASALCLVPTRVLLEQWTTALAGSFPDVGRLGDGTYRLGPVTVATYASASAWAPRIGDRFGLVVIDEAHHVGAECPIEILEMLVAPARLGLTATPPLGDAADVLERHVGGVVYSLAIGDLVGDALADYELVTVPIRLERDERARYSELRERFSKAFQAFLAIEPTGNWLAFSIAASKSAEGRAALAAWRASRALLAFPHGKRAALRELLSRHAAVRTLVFTGDNATAYAIARELLVLPITHEIGRKERAIAVERFRSGEASVLVSSQVLDEGFDVPDAEIAVIVGGSASTRRHVQRIGRVLRPSAGKRARVYELTVVATAEVHQSRRRRQGLYEEAVS
jgi:superfamily II DNA or RNA helicase